MIVIKITATVTIMILIMTRMKTITTLKITKMTEVSFQAVFGMSRMSRMLRSPERKFTVKLILLQILKYLFMSVGFQRGCYSEGYKKSGSHWRRSTLSDMEWGLLSTASFLCIFPAISLTVMFWCLLAWNGSETSSGKTAYGMLSSYFSWLQNSWIFFFLFLWGGIW